jgi:hypothetical protein
MNQLITGFEQGREKRQKPAFGTARDDHLVGCDHMALRSVEPGQDLAQCRQTLARRVAEGRRGSGLGEGIDDLSGRLETRLSDEP